MQSLIGDGTWHANGIDLNTSTALLPHHCESQSLRSVFEKCIYFILHFVQVFSAQGVVITK